MKSRSINLVCIITLICLLPWVPQKAFAIGTTDNQSAVVGKVLNYEDSFDTFTIYGRRSIMNDDGWQIVETQKFYQVIPENDVARQSLLQSLGSGVKVFGISQTVTGLREQNLLAETTLPYNPEADKAAGISAAFGPSEGPFDWIGFGVANRPTYLSTIDLKKGQGQRVTEFVNSLARLRDSLVGCEGEVSADVLPYILDVMNGAKDKKGIYSSTFQWWKDNINTKWVLEKNQSVLNQLNDASGGFAFYKGKLGSNGGYIEDASIIRPDLDKYMNSVDTSNGGSVVIESASGVFFGEFTYEPKTKTTYITGPFFKHPEDIIEDIERVKNNKPSQQNFECWKTGIPPETGQNMVGRKYWVSGSKVLIYKKGVLIDYFYSVDKTLTVNEFNSVLNFIREISLKGGM